MSEKNKLPFKKAELTVVFDEEQETFEMDTNTTILEAALDQDIDVPFSCQGGVCTTCMAKVLKGKAVMEKNIALSDEEVEEGFILTCQAHPVTQKITVDYDDV